MADTIQWSDPDKGFQVSNPQDLEQLLKLAEQYKGQKKPIGDKTELGHAYVQAKQAYYTDDTIGPGYIKDLLSRAEPEAEPEKAGKKPKDPAKEKDKRFDAALKEAGVPKKVYDKFVKDFDKRKKERDKAIARKAKGDDVIIPELLEPPVALLNLVQAKLEVEPSETKNAETSEAIKDDKNEHWINSQVTSDSQQKIADMADAIKKARSEGRHGGVSFDSGEASHQLPGSAKGPRTGKKGGPDDGRG